MNNCIKQEELRDKAYLEWFAYNIIPNLHLFQIGNIRYSLSSFFSFAFILKLNKRFKKKRRYIELSI